MLLSYHARVYGYVYVIFISLDSSYCTCYELFSRSTNLLTYSNVMYLKGMTSQCTKICAEFSAMPYITSVFSQKVVTRHNCVLSKQPIKSLN